MLIAHVLKNLVTFSISINQYITSVTNTENLSTETEIKALAVIKYLNNVTMKRENVIFAAVAGVGAFEDHQAASYSGKSWDTSPECT